LLTPSREAAKHNDLAVCAFAPLREIKKEINCLLRYRFSGVIKK
jgi:hypothetical protein